MSHQVLLPDGWSRPKGYAHGMLAQGKMLFTGGIIGWDENGVFAGADMASQLNCILQNTVAILQAGGAAPEHVVRMTWYITDRAEYVAQQRALGACYRQHFGRHFPPMAVICVSALIELQAVIEIETTAVIPVS